MDLNLDPYTVLSRAVDSIDRDSYAVRFAIYEKEHKLLVQRLASASPTLSDADIAREEQAFRDAIRKIEFGDNVEVQPPEQSLEKTIAPDPRLVPEFGDHRAEERGFRLSELSHRKTWPKQLVWTRNLGGRRPLSMDRNPSGHDSKLDGVGDDWTSRSGRTAGAGRPSWASRVDRIWHKICGIRMPIICLYA
jgi:hypothetical protein